MIRPQHIGKNKFLVLVGILVLSVGLTAYLVITSLWGGGPTLVAPLPVGSGVRQQSIDTEFSSSFLNQEPYTLLRQYVPLPVRSGQKGRSDPFAELLYQPPAPEVSPTVNE